MPPALKSILAVQESCKTPVHRVLATGQCHAEGLPGKDSVKGGGEEVSGSCLSPLAAGKTELHQGPEKATPQQPWAAGKSYTTTTQREAGIRARASQSCRTRWGRLKGHSSGGGTPGRPQGSRVCGVPSLQADQEGECQQKQRGYNGAIQGTGKAALAAAEGRGTCPACLCPCHQPGLQSSEHAGCSGHQDQQACSWGLLCHLECLSRAAPRMSVET